MLELIDSVPGRVMDRPAYHADRARESDSLVGVLWKLERAQFFNEQGDTAWDAFKAGDWGRVLEIFESERESVTARVREETDRGFEFRRLRVVEDPPSAYLRWEMHSHKVFAESGRPIRVIAAKELADLESVGPLPEVHVLGDRVAYQVHYEADMTPIGAKRIDDAEVARAAAAEIERLYERAEPLLDYFAREIAPLGPPEYPTRRRA
ncbi:hypothetical protein CLV63_114166 [Murinocardiopsis flavida]|uniref:DUF6879 domain-containing protein n=1 Tax=Murinocardiopsis flavida TaxID=645275 RepID=A0A2P8DET4_9ACTN|nr:DUF6879 family protein [Murinocardiopsis flavida]PSK95733.1 hypothetical protein CLV63_114166 [Murinocardiopsis flavida]